jgi:hypothetical protein
MNSLALCLDAGNIKSYPGSGNSWFDLSGNNFHMSLKNSPTFAFSGDNKYFDLDGSNHHGICDGTVSGSVSATVSNLRLGGTNPKTVVCVATVDNGIGSNFGGLFDLGDTGVNGQEYSLRMDGYNSFRAQMWGTPGPDYDISYNSTSTWTMFSVVYGSDKIGKTYGNNGTLLGQDGSAFDLVTAGSRPFEMGRSAGTSYFGGKVAMYLVYQKALTVAEIQQNYNALKGRFGLT